MRQNPELTATDFYAFVKASVEYKYFLCLSLLPLTCLICVVFSCHFLPRIRAKENVVVKQMYEQNKTLQAELNTQKEILENHIADLHQRETGFKAVMKRFWEDLDSRELAINIARAKADEVNRNLSVRKKELDSGARAIEIKEADLNRRERNLIPLEKQLADLKTSVQAQAAETQESLTKAKKQAVTILDQAKQDAQVTVLRAEAEAADVLERAVQEARPIISHEREQCKALWAWCHYKAAGAEVTPAKWKEVKRLLQRVQAKVDLSPKLQGQFLPTGQLQDPEAAIIKEFIQSSCVHATEGLTQTSVLYQAYVDWSEGYGNIPMSQTSFGLALGKLGFERVRGTGGTRFWRGICLE